MSDGHALSILSYTGIFPLRKNQCRGSSFSFLAKMVRFDHELLNGSMSVMWLRCGDILHIFFNTLVLKWIYG